MLKIQLDLTEEQVRLLSTWVIRGYDSTTMTSPAAWDLAHDVRSIWVTAVAETGIDNEKLADLTM